MSLSIAKTKLLVFFIFIAYLIIFTDAISQNKTLHHVRRSSVDDSFFKNQKQGFYRSYQPVSIKYHKISYPKTDDRTDYDITSYDTEYGGVVSNFTSSIYDDNPPLYPNPEVFVKNNQALKMNSKTENEVELPDDSLADADLKEHNIIDSVTYLYGFNNCHGDRNEWIILIYIASAITIILLLTSMMWVIWSDYAAEFRKNSKLYPININLSCCMLACTLIYIQAVMGVSSQSQCERIALLLHYTYLTSASWIITLTATVAEYCACGTMMPLKYNYLLAYGVPAIVVMFNYALSMEHYETKHYCWMSLEKGMVIGFMVPITVLILINTIIIMVGLQGVQKKQGEMLQAKLQEVFDRHDGNYSKNDQVDGANVNDGEVIDTVDNMFIAESNRKNTDSSETLEDDHFQYVNISVPDKDATEDGNDSNKDKDSEGKLEMMYPDHMYLKYNLNPEGNQLKTYLHLGLVMEPFFGINWVMGVAALENATHWTTPTIYLILTITMYIYYTATISITLPIICNKQTPAPCCHEVVSEPTLVPARTTDSIPLLDPTVQQPNVSTAPADTISTISI
ncbi:unnamed protein product [Parnassius mnemosyne]|uniref:G-protein coupled receptors family 2 profile 2 domain-containing protein n=1 Tax=Parnassius mnemosyne TaxID=213953 RepID=A0AAV1LLK9_9NEOP